MDSKQFDELVARLASGQSRREALKGIAGGVLATIGITSVADSVDSRGKNKGRKANAQGQGGKGKGRKANAQGQGGKGKGRKANAQGKGGKGKGRKAAGERHGRGHGKAKCSRADRKEKFTICHNGNTIVVSQCAWQRAHKHHSGDHKGPCYG